MIETTEQTGNVLPLTFEPPSDKHMRLWAKFGERAANANDMRVLQEVYAGYAWECCVVENLAHIRDLFSWDGSAYIVFWLNSTAFDVQCAIGHWTQVVSDFQEHAIPGERWAKEAARHVEQLNQFLVQVCSYALTFCTQHGFEMPEHLRQACAALFPA